MTPFEAQTLLDKVKGTDESVLGFYMDWKDVADALETIAEMRWEYAAQYVDNGCYLREDGDGQIVQTTPPSYADWWSDRQACAEYVKWWNANHDRRVRMVSRLIEDPEVTE